MKFALVNGQRQEAQEHHPDGRARPERHAPRFSHVLPGFRQSPVPRPPPARGGRAALRAVQGARLVSHHLLGLLQAERPYVRCFGLPRRALDGIHTAHTPGTDHYAAGFITQWLSKWLQGNRAVNDYLGTIEVYRNPLEQ